MLELLILTPIIGSFILLFMPSNNVYWIRMIALYTSLFTFIISILIWLFFDYGVSNFQFVSSFLWFSSFNINVFVGIDSISLLFIILTTLIFPLCILNSWKSVSIYLKEYMILFLVMESLLLIVFSVLDLLLFYVFFESILIPMYLLIGVWGSRTRKIRASYMFFFYTLGGSVLLLLSIMAIYAEVGTTDYQVLLLHEFSPFRQKVLWLAFFISFASKVPMVPFHIWLPEAHVEAPTTGSVVLAGILLKLGTYGFIRFSIPLFPYATLYFTPFLYTLATIGVVYTSLTAIRQTDLKRVIAYASVAHMNMILLGLFSLNIQGVEGSIFQMISHGIVSSALFLCVGVIYDRHHTRLIKYYSGLVHTMPLFIPIFLMFMFANAALPGTCNFIGEFLILTGIFQDNLFITILSATSVVLSAVYSLWLFNRIAYGNLKVQYIKQFYDINYREFMVLVPLIFLTIFLGVFPDAILNKLHILEIYY
jgi:proton-translocating NADH-quinone oxidoreductase chain M|tara:strand:+ start:2432 stop:3868 length:1437 start_codon:yes stop_codon:yes gene_type:complete